MSKKVLYVITKSNWGGAQRYVFDLATSLPSPEYEVKVVFGGSGLLAQKLYKANIPTISLEKLWRDINIFEDIKAFFTLIKIFKSEKPDVVHLNSSKIGGMGALAARVAGVKKIFFTVHGFAFNENRSALQKRIIKFLSWLTIFLCTDTIFISKTELEKAQKWPFIKNKIHLVYNGINPPEFLSRDIAQKELAQTINLYAGNFVRKLMIGSIAELTPNKGLEYSIKALKELPNAIYIIMGTGEDQKKLKDLIHSCNLEDRVFLAGFIPDAARYLKAFDVFALPSLKEGLPYVLLEAGYSGLPVVSTHVGGVPELIDESTGILVDPQHIYGLEKAFATLSDEKKREKFSLKYQQKISESFSFEQMVKNTTKLYSIDKNKK